MSVGGTLPEHWREYGTRAKLRRYADLSAEPFVLSGRQNKIQVPLGSIKKNFILFNGVGRVTIFEPNGKKILACLSSKCNVCNRLVLAMKQAK